MRPAEEADSTGYGVRLHSVPTPSLLLAVGWSHKYSFGVYTGSAFTLSGIPMSILEYHVLLALAGGPLYGYAIKEAVASESGGTVTPRAGSLYRVIARLTTAGLVIESDPADEPPPHPGHARRYYTLTAVGRRALAGEAARLKRTAAVAQKRLGVVQGRT